MTAGPRRNFNVLLTQGVLNNTAYAFSSDRMVLPFLFAAAGGPAIFAGLIMPMVIVCKFSSQLVFAPIISRAGSHRIFIGASTVITALALAAVSMLFDRVSTSGVVLLFLTAAAITGAASGVGSLAYGHMSGRLFSADKNSKLMFSQSAIAGILAIGVALASMVILPPGSSLAAHREVILLGVALYLCSAVVIFWLVEPDASVQPSVTISVRSRFEDLGKGFRLAFALPWFPRFVIVRACFLSVELAIPFYSIHAAALHSNSTTGLSIFVIASSLGLVIGGVFWPKIVNRSFRHLFALSAAIAFIAGVLALVVEFQSRLQSPWADAPVFVLIGLAAQGSKIGRSVYVSSKSSDAERPFCISVSNVITGLLSVALGLLIGIVAMFKGVTAPIMVIMGLNVLAALLVRRLA